MKSFEGLGLNPVLAKSLAYMKYETPTPIQAQAIPPALDGRDVMGTAQTGTGKTAAFAIPLVEALLRNSRGSALVLTPTRELGKQVMGIMQQLLGPKTKIKSAFLIGGESMGPQLKQLRQRPRLIVGTPGRINDHLERGNLMLHDTEFLVLDEVDRMLDMGFSVQIDRILKYVTRKPQTLMFSATLPKSILKLSEKYLDNPARVSVGSTSNPAKNITQNVIKLEQADKHKELVCQLHERSGSIVVFVKTKHGSARLAKKLNKQGFEADAIHGDLNQNRRDRVISNFRSKKYRILVATDVAARGLDIPHIRHVINYDLPQVPEDYIHRIGRTARAGAEGEALCLVTPQDGQKWKAILHLMNPDEHRDPGTKKNKPRRSRYKGKKAGGGQNGQHQGHNNGEKQKPNGKKRRAAHGKPKKQHRKGQSRKHHGGEQHAAA